MAGTESSLIRAADNRALARIAYPAEGSIIALDPDIPPQHQRIPLRLSAPAGNNWRWQLDAQPLGPADRLKHWLPQPGKHRLTLHDAQNTLIDSVTFEVRALRSRR